MTERELQLLQAVQGSLKQSQSREQFQANLRRLRERLLVTVHGPEKAEELMGARPAAAPEPAAPEVRTSEPDFSQMGPLDLGRVDTSKLSERELDAYIARGRELGLGTR